MMSCMFAIILSINFIAEVTMMPNDITEQISPDSSSTLAPLCTGQSPVEEWDEKVSTPS